jgi:murein endopeptidase
MANIHEQMKEICVSELVTNHEIPENKAKELISGEKMTQIMDEVWRAQEYMLFKIAAEYRKEQ